MSNDPLADDDFERASRRGSRRTAIILGGFVGLAVGGVLIARTMMASAERKQAGERAATAFASLGRCLMGPTPLAAGETLTVRVHRVAVNREPVAADAPESETRTRWPYRCAEYATTLRDSVTAMGAMDASRTRLRDTAERARSALTRGQLDTQRLPEGQTSYLDALWAAAAAAHLPAASGAAPRVPDAPPVNSTMLARADFRPLFPVTGAREMQFVMSDRTPGAALRVLVWHGTLTGCRFARGTDAASSLATARCQALGAEPMVSASDVTLFDADDAYDGFPTVRVGAGRNAKLVAIPGTEASAPAQPRPGAFRGQINSEGVLTVIESGAVELDEAVATGRWRLSRQRGASAPVRSALTLPPESSRPDFAGDRIIYLASSEPGAGPARVGLFSRALPAGTGAPGAPVDTGDVPEDSRILARCRTALGTAIVVGAPTGTQMVFGVGDTFVAPSRVESRARPVNATCNEADAVATWLDARAPIVHQIRCTAQSCTHAEARVGSLGSVITRVGDAMQVAALGDRVLMVWSPQEGGLRMRLAPLAELNTARDTVIYDDHGHRGGWVESPTLLVRRGVAVVAFVDAESEADGRRALAIRIDRDGAFRAVAPE